MSTVPNLVMIELPIHPGFNDVSLNYHYFECMNTTPIKLKLLQIHSQLPSYKETFQ